jgi:hypothetical protein
MKNGGDYGNTFGRFFDRRGNESYVEHYKNPKEANCYYPIGEKNYFLRDNCNNFKLELIYG